MPAYFVSDVHLRLDRPERGRRLARLVEGLGREDLLYLVGDLCDFWFASRQARGDVRRCPGLRALAEFVERGGSLTVLPGNHDAWLGPFFESQLGARFETGPLEVEVAGLRLHLTHGHRLGGGSLFKRLMESRTFLVAYGWLPEPVAKGLQAGLSRFNRRTHKAVDRRLMASYRRYAAGLDPGIDLAVFGHIHFQPLDDPSVRPRLIVLGDWLRGRSYLRVDPTGATLVVEPEPAAVVPS